MASLEKYTNDMEVLFQLRHDFRASPKPGNFEIDPALSKNNYCLSPESHGRTAEECMKYYKKLIGNSYIYGKDSKRDIVRGLQWCITAPADLPEDQKEEFFKAAYEYMNSIYGEENCICAVVHTDEIMKNKKGERVSHDHLHYLAVPRVANNKHLSLKDKFTSGLEKISKSDKPILFKNDDLKNLTSAVFQFYKKEISKNQAVSMIAKNLECKYADAKKIFNSVTIKESEFYEMKLNSDALTSRKQLHEFHPAFQRFLEDRGIHCTVSFKSQGIDRGSFTVAEAKTVTRVTGLSVEQIKEMEIENEILQDQVKSLTAEVEKSKTIDNTKDADNASGWGSSSGWGKERGEKEWEKEY